MLGPFELWAAIPAGFTFGFSPLKTFFWAVTGGTCGSVAVAVLGVRLRDWALKKIQLQISLEGEGRFYRIWNRYGIPGIGLLSPLLTGPFLGMLIGLALSAEPKRLLFWTVCGVLLWSAGLTLAGMTGLAGFRALAG